MIVDVLIWLAVAGLLGIGVAAMIVPSALSQLFGAPVTEPNAIVFVRAAGARDILIGAILAYAHARDIPTIVTVTLAAGALLALTDFALTRHLSHAVGVVGFAILTYLSIVR